MSSSPLIPARIRLLLGSSKTGRPAALFLHAELEPLADIGLWCEGEPVPLPMAFDAAVFVVCGDRESAVFFRLGVFLGALGRERVVACPATAGVELPPDLHGLTVASDLPTIKHHLRRLADSTALARAASGPEIPGQVARRLRRSLGTACSVQAGQTLRIADISLSGALLETYGEIPENQVLDLELTLENGRRVGVAAKVVRIQYPQWGRVGGVGVQFVRFEGAAQADLARYLEATGALG